MKNTFVVELRDIGNTQKVVNIIFLNETWSFKFFNVNGLGL